MSTNDTPGQATSVTPEHASLLASKAVSQATIEAHGIYSITSVDQLPEEFASWGEKAVPAIVFPWNTIEGETVLQLRPDTPIEVQGEKRPRKYLWPKGCGSVIGVGRVDEGSETVYFVEGTKQTLAASEIVDSGSVYGIAGCRTWSSEGVPANDLEVVEDKHVVLIFDNDIEDNIDVWTAAEKFTRALNAEGAASIRYVVLPGGKRAGLDDILGGKAPEKRAKMLARLVEQSKKKLGGTGGIPKPKPKKGPEGGGTEEVGTPDRPAIQVNDDRHEVIRAIVDALMKWNATRLFSYGGKLAELRSEDGHPAIEVLDRDQFGVLVQSAATTVQVDAKGNATYVWPDSVTMGSSLSAASERLAKLVRVTETPFLRPDGTICQTSGYDPETKTQVILSDGLAAIQVPDEPSEEDVSSAVKLLRDDWLGDFMPLLATPADKANMIALMLTPLIRSMVPTVPLAVVDGLQAGVGKGKVASILAILATGRDARLLPYNRDDDEWRKTLTAAFRNNSDLFIFDEAHVVEGASFQRALTTTTWEDRALGGNVMVDFPNTATWVSLGNQVVLNGDMNRRAYRIAMTATVPNPQDRPESDFRHPDILAWTTEHRSELLAAAFTLVRAWYVAGQPAAKDPIAFGSFERWTKLIGGVLENAGITGFLTNLVEWRSETDYERSNWSDHVHWLHRTYGADTQFTTGEVTKALQTDRFAEMPHRMDDPAEKGFGRKLGMAYARQKNRQFGSLVLRKSSVMGHGSVVRWYVEEVGRPGNTEGDGSSPETGPQDSEGLEVPEVPLPPTCSEKELSPEEMRDESSQEPVRDTHAHGGRDGSTPSSASSTSTPGNEQVTGRFSTEGDEPVTQNRALWTTLNFADPSISPIEHLVGGAVSWTPLPCEDCRGPLALVPPAGFWYACPTCHPATFERQ